MDGGVAWSTCINVNDPAAPISLPRRCSISLRRDRSASELDGYGLSISRFFDISSFDTIQFTNSAAASLFGVFAWIMIVFFAKTDITRFLLPICGIREKSIGNRPH